ncbi:9069_t:CDS:1, partial [Funneliformis geosporum]
MVYPEGDRSGEILSQFLQKKAMEFIKNTIYKEHSDVHGIQKKKIQLLQSENKKLQNNKKKLIKQ